jgi:hypothetical protein
MPCNASYARFIFGKFFTSTIILYVLLFAQNFYSFKKWVLHMSKAFWCQISFASPKASGSGGLRCLAQ